MRLVSYSRSGAAAPSLGLLDIPEPGAVLDLAAALSVLDPGYADDPRLRTLDALLEGWTEVLPLARAVAEKAAGATGAARERLAPALERRDAVRLHPPVTRPPTIRDFYAFEAHVRTARGRRGLPVPPEWYEFPAFYYSNPGSLVGDGVPVRRPSWTAALDYELEVACVIGVRARDVPADQWRAVVAGLTILNDWSARDVQRREMAIGLGPAKGKDFATSVGPALVTLDELESRRRGERYDLAMEARVNGRTLSRGNVSELHYTFGQMIARASQDVYLLPGDIIGSGTVGTGCLLELGPDVHPWLQPGDEVTLQIDLLGTLSNSIL